MKLMLLELQRHLMIHFCKQCFEHSNTMLYFIVFSASHVDDFNYSDSANFKIIKLYVVAIRKLRGRKEFQCGEYNHQFQQTLKPIKAT